MNKEDGSDLLYLQVAAQIRRAIADGEAKPGERLPPARDLATVLGVNTNTVLRSLRLLQDEGLLELRRRRGITVAGTPERGAVMQKVRDLVEFARGAGIRRRRACRDDRGLSADERGPLPRPQLVLGLRYRHPQRHKQLLDEAVVLGRADPPLDQVVSERAKLDPHRQRQVMLARDRRCLHGHMVGPRTGAPDAGCSQSAAKRPLKRLRPHLWRPQSLCSSDGRYWARTSDPQLVELVLSQLS